MRRNLTVTTKILTLSTLAAILALFVAIVWAQGNPDDPEDGRVSPIDRAGSSGDVEVQTVPGQNEPGVVRQDPEGETTPPASPAAPAAVDEVEMQLDPEAPAEDVTLFKSIAGANFHPRESTTTHQYGGAGCTYRTSVSGFLVSDLQMPEGAEIDFLRLYFHDSNSNHDAQVWLYNYDGQGSFEQIATATSSGAPGQSSAGSGFFSHVVENTTGSLGLVAGTEAANDNSVRICGVRVRYKVEVPSWTMLPAVLKQYIGE